MSYLRAVMRRLDPWAALLLGVLLALGVVILLATPGPWHRVVGPAPAVKLTPPAPNDVAVFVLGGRDGSCSGVVWLHVDAEESSLTAVVVARRVAGFVPGSGYAPLSDIVDAAGPRAAGAALGEALDVSMDAWVTLDRKAFAQAVKPMFPMDDVRAARGRYRLARAAWRGRGGAERSWVMQYETLREALPRVAFDRLNVVSFSNYVLGFGFVQSDLTLQGVTTLADTLHQVDPGRVDVRAAAVVVERCRGGEAWHVDSSRLESLRQSLAFGLLPPDGGARIVRRERAASVLVVAPMPRPLAVAYAEQVRRSLLRSAGAPVEVRLVSGASSRLAFRAARAMDEQPPLAVLVGPPVTVDQPAVAAVAKVYAMLRRRGQEAVAAGPLPTAATSAAPTASPGAMIAALTAGELPVSWLPALAPATTASSPRATLRRAARAHVQTLVRACWPGALAPRLAATKLGFSFVAARHTGVGVLAATDAAAAPILAGLRLWGYAGERLEAGGQSWEPPVDGSALSFRPGQRTAAAALAGDLGLRPLSVAVDAAAPRPLVVVVAE